MRLSKLRTGRFARVRGLVRDDNGQVLLYGAVIAVVLLIFLLVIPNSTHVMTQKVRSQTAADAGAYTGSVWLARGLNLNASLNVGVKSMYTWMTVLTMASALAQALYSDTHDLSVRQMGQGITQALFDNSDPVYVANNVYPQAIQKLAETMQWLGTMQDDIARTFPMVAQTAGGQEACRNASGGDPASQNPGGATLVSTGDTLPTEVNGAGDSLVYFHLLQLAAALDTIPTNDPNIGPATGVILVDPNNLEIRAYYGDSSEWCTVRQVLKRLYKKPVVQTFRHNYTNVIDSGIEYFQSSGGSRYVSYLQGDSWARYVLVCNEGGPHTPFIWPNGRPTPPYKNTAMWTLLNCHPGDARYKIDTVWIENYVVRRSDPAYGRWNVGRWQPGDSILPGVSDSGFEVESSYAYPTDFYTGAESTRGNQGTRVRPRRLSPDADLFTVSFVWRLGDTSQSPFGPAPRLGRAVLPRERVAAPCPMLSVAQARPYLALASPTEEDYFFSPNWEVRLVPIDSAGVYQITSDPRYEANRLSAINLEDLLKYVLLP